MDQHPLSLRFQPLVGILLASCLGICTDRWLGFQPETTMLVASAALICWGLLFRQRLSPKLAGCCLLLFVAASMAIWSHCHGRLFAADHLGLAALNNDVALPTAIRGRVISVPESTPLAAADPLSTLPEGIQTRFLIRVDNVRDREQWLPASGKLAVRVDGHLLGFWPGDAVQVFGILNAPRRPMNPGESDTAAARRAERILCRLSVPYPECVSLTRRAGPSIWAGWGRLRGEGLALLDRYVSPERSGLAGALLLGARERLDPDRVELFLHTGTIHLLAISGLHVGILAWSFFVLARGTAYRQSILLALMCVAVVYCCLTGMRPPVMRAVILVLVVCVGMLLRRKVLAWNALAGAAVILLVVQPSSLFRPGAQLSFLAVATLVWLGMHVRPPSMHPLERLIAKSRPWYEKILLETLRRAKELLLAGIVIWMVTLPLVTHSFHLLSPISLVLNLFLILPITIALLSGFVVLTLGPFIPPLAAVAGGVCDFSLSVFESIVQLAHEIPGGWCWVPGPSVAWCVVFYAGLCLLACLKGSARRRWYAIGLLSLWLAIPAGVTLVDDELRCLIATEAEPLRCTFLSVGHGTCVVIEFPDNRVMLYDCGRMGRPRTGVRVVSEFLWSRGISHIDAVLVSHADADHYNILPGLLERFSVGEILASPFMFDSKAAGVLLLAQHMQDADVPTRALQFNDVLHFGEATIRILHPPPSGVAGSDNANSIVAEIEYLHRRILLPGDLEAAGMDDLLAECPGNVDVLMAPHHGSANSEPQLFLAWCNPEFVVVSGGRDSLTPATRPLFARPGCRLLHTAEVGAVTVMLDANDCSVETFRPENVHSD